MDELRSCWELPSIAYFCQAFREPLKLPEVDIEELEESILLSATAEGSEILTSLMCNLLKGCFGRRDIEQNNCDTYLRKLLDKRWSERSVNENPMNERDFRELHPRKKVEILYELCQWRLLSDDVGDLVKDFDGGALRVEPIGSDEKGSLYWYFVGTRLYKETPPKIDLKKQTKSHGSDRKKAGSKKKKLHAKKKTKATKKGAPGKRLTKSLKTAGGKNEDDDQSTTSSLCAPATAAAAAARWELLCSTVDEWQALADSFKNSRVRCEIDLYNRLTEEFLVIIPKIFDEKERIMRKKLLEMAPKRTSSRLQHKRHEHEEQLKIIEQLEIAERLEKEQMEDARRRAAEEEKKLAAQHAREERQRIKEERAQRALLREMRATLIAEGKEVPPELFGIDSPAPSTPSAPATCDDNAVSQSPAAGSVVSDHNDEDVGAKLSKVLFKIRKHKHAWPFLEPVPESVAPDYYTVVLRPMDLSKIESKLKKKEYARRQEFEADFNQMIGNCELYNGPSSEYTALAFSLRDAFNKVMDKCFAPKKPRAVQGVALSDVQDDSAVAADRVANDRHAELATTVAMRTVKAVSHHSKILTVASATASLPSSSLPGAVVLPGAFRAGGSELSSDAKPVIHLQQEPGKIVSPSIAAGSLLSAISSHATTWGIAGGRPLAPSAGTAAAAAAGSKPSTAHLPTHSSPSFAIGGSLKQPPPPQQHFLNQPTVVSVKQQQPAEVAGHAWINQTRPRLPGSGLTLQAAAASAAASLSPAPATSQVVASGSLVRGQLPAPLAAAAAQTTTPRLAGWGAVAAGTAPTASLAAHASMPRPVALPVGTASVAAATSKPFAIHVVNSTSPNMALTGPQGSHATVLRFGGSGSDHGVPGSKSSSAAAMAGVPWQIAAAVSGAPTHATSLALNVGATAVQPVSVGSSLVSGTGDVSAVVNGLRPPRAELGTSVGTAVTATSSSRSAVGIGIGSSLVALKHGWLPSHLNLPVSSSGISCGDANRVGQGSGGLAGGRPAALGLSMSETSLKRPADAAADSDVSSSKKPTLPSTPAASAAAAT